MLSVAEALAAVLRETPGQPPVRRSLADALGHVLAEDVASDIDSPPYDKAMVDGYAIRTADLAASPAAGMATFRVIEEVTAGDVPKRHLSRGAATRIMTGAPIPPGADGVVMVERVASAGVSGPPSTEQIYAGEATVTLNDPRASPGQNILPRGTSLRAGEVVLRAPAVLRSIEIGLLAEIGRTDVVVVPRPTVAILATGNELVPAGERPDHGQIRNSNGPMLAAAVREAGAVPVELGIVRDDPDRLAAAIAKGLAADVLLLSGGVSAGVLDLAPATLEAAGVRKVFHKVHFKPGKPLWFGVRERALVFGLPGNPVSSWVCFELFVRPALWRLAGRAHRSDCDPTRVAAARLARPHEERGDRPAYHPAVVRPTPDGPVAEPLAWHGSADLAGLAGANALLVLEPKRAYRAGELVAVRMIDGNS